ncbi:MAG: PTS glucose transporter subunit IIB [Metamycoplasmataceae bacterium]
MTNKEKFIYWFLIIITFGLILLYWKTKKVETKDELSRREKISININKLVLYLGGSKNIKSTTSTHTKVKIFFNDRDKIEVQKIKEIDGISGIFMTSNYIQIIVGNEALSIENYLNLLIV